MNKMISLFLVCIMLLISLPAHAEESGLAGDWYAELNGLSAQLTLKEDGTYSFSMPGSEAVSGTWEERDGFIYMDGAEKPDLCIIGELLRMGDQPVFFTREEPELYTPAEPAEDVTAGDFSGYWKSAYVDSDGLPLPAYYLDDHTDLYVDGTSAILGGPVFGDTQVKLAFENGTLACESDGAAVLLQIQKDGYLRLTFTGSETAPQTWYLVSAWTSALDGEEEPEE